MIRRGGGVVVSVPASRASIPGSNLGRGLPTVRSEGRTKLCSRVGCKKIHEKLEIPPPPHHYLYAGVRCADVLSILNLLVFKNPIMENN